MKKANERSIDALNDHARRLVAAFTANGADALRAMSVGEVSLLLSQKMTHLNQVSQRCARGEGVFVNAPLKKLLEAHCREIAGHAQTKDRDMEMEM